MSIATKMARELAAKLEARVKLANKTGSQMMFAIPPFPGAYFEFKRSINFDSIVAEVKAKHKDVVMRLAVELDDYLRMAMRAGWSWTGGARDIVDTGALMDSGGAFASDDKILVNYESPYANLVHFGGYVAPYGNQRAEKVYIPGRPWVAMAFGLAPGPLPPFNFKERYQAYMDA